MGDNLVESWIVKVKEAMTDTEAILFEHDQLRNKVIRGMLYLLKRHLFDILLVYFSALLCDR